MLCSIEDGIEPDRKVPVVLYNAWSFGEEGGEQYNCCRPKEEALDIAEIGSCPRIGCQNPERIMDHAGRWCWICTHLVDAADARYCRHPAASSEVRTGQAWNGIRIYHRTGTITLFYAHPPDTRTGNLGPASIACTVTPLARTCGDVNDRDAGEDVHKQALWARGV